MSFKRSARYYRMKGVWLEHKSEKYPKKRKLLCQLNFMQVTLQVSYLTSTISRLLLLPPSGITMLPTHCSMVLWNA